MGRRRRVLLIDDVATLAGVTVREAQELLRAKLGPAVFRHEGRERLFLAEEVVGWLLERQGC